MLGVSHGLPYILDAAGAGDQIDDPHGTTVDRMAKLSFVNRFLKEEPVRIVTS